MEVDLLKELVPYVEYVIDQIMQLAVVAEFASDNARLSEENLEVKLMCHSHAGRIAL